MGASEAGGQAADRISSPEQLNEYLRVTNPKIWMLLGAVILLIVGLLAWSAAVTIESYATGTAHARGGELTVTFDDAEKASKVKAGMQMEVGGGSTQIVNVGADAEGNVIASAKGNLPDGTYDVRVGYNTMQVISMLFN